MKSRKTQKNVIKCRVIRNKSATADKVPWLVGVQLNGTMSLDEVVHAIHREAPELDEITIRMVLDGTKEMLEQIFAKNPNAVVHTPIGIAKLVVPGSIDHIPAKGEKLPETLHPQMRIYPSKKLRDAVKNANFEFECVNGPEAEMSIRRVVTDSLGREGMNVVKPGERFTVTGAGFSGCEAEPLTAELTDSANVTHAVELVSVKPDVVECVAPAGLAKGKAKLVLVQPLGPEPIYGRLTASRNVTVA